MTRSSSLGQTLAELAMIIIMLTMASFTGLTLLGGNLNMIAGGAQSDFIFILNPDGTNKIVSLGTNGTGGLGNILPAPQETQEHICFSSGFCVNSRNIHQGTNVTTMTERLGSALTTEVSGILKEQVLPQLETQAVAATSFSARHLPHP